jgi:hypothetical protein
MVCPARAAINVSKNEGVKVIRNRLGTEYVCRVVWGDSGDEPLPTRLATDFNPLVKMQGVSPGVETQGYNMCTSLRLLANAEKV